MTGPVSLRDLALETVHQPRQAARWLMERGFTTETITLGFALVVVCSSVLFAAVQAIAPASEETQMVQDPWTFLTIQSAIILASVFAFTAIGRLMGGKGKFSEIAVLLIWLQALAVTGQAAIMLWLSLTGLFPALLLAILMGAVLWITHQFLSEAHGFDGPLRAVGLMGLGFVAIAIMMAVVFTFLGIVPQEVSPHV